MNTLIESAKDDKEGAQQMLGLNDDQYKEFKFNVDDILNITKNKLALLWYVKNLGNEIETKTSKNLKAVYVFNKRIDWVETKLGWLFAWYVWDKNYIGDTIIKRIDI